MSFKDWVDLVGKAIDAVGVSVIVVGVLATTVWSAMSSRRVDGGDLFRTYRRGIGKSILLGLEFLVAADSSRRSRFRRRFEAPVCWRSSS